MALTKRRVESAQEFTERAKMSLGPSECPPKCECSAVCRAKNLLFQAAAMLRGAAKEMSTHGERA